MGLVGLVSDLRNLRKYVASPTTRVADPSLRKQREFDTPSTHDRYQKIYRLIADRDEELARAFDDPRRSTAILQLAAINSYGLLSEEELLSFTPETRETVALLSKPPKGARGPKRA